MHKFVQKIKFVNFLTRISHHHKHTISHANAINHTPVQSNRWFCTFQLKRTYFSIQKMNEKLKAQVLAFSLSSQEQQMGNPTVSPCWYESTILGPHATVKILEDGVIPIYLRKFFLIRHLLVCTCEETFSHFYSSPTDHISFEIKHIRAN